MKLRTMIATGATVLALTAGYANAKPAGTSWVWTEFADVIDFDAGQGVTTFADSVWQTRAGCQKDVKAKFDTSAQPPCIDNGNGTCTGTYTFYRCLQGLYGTPLN